MTSFSNLSNLSKFLVIISAIFLLWSLFSRDDVEQGGSKHASRATVSKVISGITSFNADLLLMLLKGHPHHNLFLSAFSLSTALSMAAEGARGETQKEMLHALGLSIDPSELAASFSEILGGLRPFQNNDYLQLSTANRLWTDKELPIQSPYSKATAHYFQAGAETCDFKHSPNQERQRINLWAEKETHGRIKGLVPPGAIDSETAMVLTNAIYFKADWARSFDKTQTVPGKFTTLSNEVIEIPMMHDKADFRFTEQETFKALEKSYKSPKGKELSMVFLLPKEDGIAGLRTVIEALKPLQPNDSPSFLSQMDTTEVLVSVPKFKIEFELEATSLLQELGMKRAFGEADFSGISPYPLSISSVIHKAFVEVNEEGTEAAAASAVVTNQSYSLNARNFNANRPFLFLILDRSSDLILFSGIVANPSGVQ